MTSRSVTVSFNPPGNGSMYFDGNGDYLTIPSSTDLNLTSGDFTIECWAYPTALTTGNMSIINKDGVSGTSYSQYDLSIDNTGKLFAFIGNGNGVSPAGTAYSGVTTITLNTWHHLAIVASGGFIIGFLDGIQQFNIAKPVMVDGSKPLLIGWQTGQAISSNFNGYVDDLRITKGTARYTSNFTVPSVPFSDNATVDPYYNNVSLLLHGDGVNTSTNFIDSSPTPKTISVFGNAQVSTTQSKFAVDTNISGYIVTSVPGGITATGVSSPITVNGLENGVEYTFNVRAITADPYYSNVSLLLHGTGSNGSTSITDSSQSPKTVTANGNAQISTAQSKFGGSSLYVDGSGDYISVPHDTTFNLGSSDFTLEAWVYLAGYATNNQGFYTSCIICKDAPSQREFTLSVTGTANSFTALQFVAFSDNTLGYSIIETPYSFLLNTWYHIAVCRQGNNLYKFVNGSTINSSGSSLTHIIQTATAPVKIGANTFNAQYQYDLNGYIDDLRITKGVARYSTSFVPPTAPFPDQPATVNSSNVSLLLHGNGSNGSTSIVDSGSSPKTISVFGNAQISTAQSKFGGSSLYFDGSGDYLSVPHNTSFSIQSSDFTLDAWVYLLIGSAESYILSKRDATSSINGWGWRINATNTLQFYYVAGSSFTSTVTVQPGVWNHIATVRSGTTLTHYINGASAGSSTISNGVENTSATLKVCASNDLTTFFNGYIDELRIVKGEALYKSSFTPPSTAYELTDGPVSAQSNKLTPTDIDPHYNSVVLLLHGDGTNGLTSFVDSSAIPKSVTSVGSAQISTTKSKFGGSSMYFSGSNYATIPTNTAFDFGTNDFTLEAFVNLPTISGTKIIIGRQEPSNGMALQLWISNNTAGVTLRTQGGGTVYYVTSAAVLTTDTWIHIAGVRYGSLLYIFINGALSGSVTIPAVTLNCSRPLTIGVLDDTVLGAYYTGYIDELRITKGVARYTANFAVPKAPFVSSKPSYDPYYSKVSLLLHGDGVHGSTSIVDSSPTPKSLTSSSSVQHSTLQSKFNGSSLFFNDSTNNYISIPASSDWNFGTSDFTIELWMYRMTGRQLYGHLFALGQSQTVFNFKYSNDYVYLYDGSRTTTVVGSYNALPLTTWTHIALVRYRDVITLYTNGMTMASANYALSLGNSTSTAYVGQGYIGPSSPNGESVAGYIDNLRVTKGVARYTSNFTVPSTQFSAYLPPPDPYYANVALLLHGEGVNGTSQFTDNSSLPGTLTASGGIAHTTSNKKFGSSSIEITNNTSKIEVVKNAAIDLTGTYTIEFWARTSTAVVGDANAVLTTNNNVYPNRFVVDFYAPNSTTILGRIATPTNTIIYTSPTQPYVLGNWAHFAFVNNSTANTHTVFINGVAVGSRAAVPLFNTTTFQVGKNGTAWTEGPYQIDDLKITNGIAKYSTAFVPPTLEDTYFDPSFSSVSLLLHGNGSNGSTSIIDSGSNTKLVTVNGSAQISTTQSKFNGSSLKMSAIGDRFSIPAHPEFDMGATTLFTIECWFYLNSNSGSGSYPALVLRGSDDTTYPGHQWALNFNPLGAGLAFNISDGAGWLNPGPNYTGAITTGVWHHVALVRTDTSATGLKLFYDGTLVASSTSNPSLETNTSSKPICVGAYALVGMNGYVDDLRITKGVARYTQTFALPTTPFPDQ